MGDPFGSKKCFDKLKASQLQALLPSLLSGYASKLNSAFTKHNPSQKRSKEI